MDSLARIFSRLSPNKFLLSVVLATVTLTCANLMSAALIYESGLGYTSIFAGPDDRFADLVKVSLSYKTFTSQIGQSEDFRSWSEFYKEYYLHNPYGGKEQLEKGKLTHFHLPPLSTLIFIGGACAIAFTKSIWIVLLLFFLVYLMTVQWTISVGIPTGAKSKALKLSFWYLALFSYPAVMLFATGNFNAGFASLLIATFMFALFAQGRVDFIVLASLAVAVNIRPNAVIFLLALPVVLGLRSSIKPMLRFIALAAGIFVVSLFVVHAIYPDYTLRAFLQGLNIYNQLYVIRGLGDGRNSSLFALIKNYNQMDFGVWGIHFAGLLTIFTGVVYWATQNRSRWIVAGPIALLTSYCMLVAFGYHQHMFEAFLLFSTLLVAGVCWSLGRSRQRLLVAPFLLTALYCLLSPVFADYHLLIFVVPVFLLFLRGADWAECYPLVFAIALGSVLMLSPKNYVLSITSASPQVILNPLILYSIALYLVKETVWQPMVDVVHCRSAVVGVK